MHGLFFAAGQCQPAFCRGRKSMNRDVFAGWWKQARGQAKSWWGQLTDDELDEIEGESEKLLGVLQSRYGWSREQAEQEIERRGGGARWNSAPQREYGAPPAATHR